MTTTLKTIDLSQVGRLRGGGEDVRNSIKFEIKELDKEIKARKDNLLDEVKKRLKQQTTGEELFTIRFKVI